VFYQILDYQIPSAGVILSGAVRGQSATRDTGSRYTMTADVRVLSPSYRSTSPRSLQPPPWYIAQACTMPWSHFQCSPPRTEEGHLKISTNTFSRPFCVFSTLRNLKAIRNAPTSNYLSAGGPNRNYAKVGHRGSGSRDLLFAFYLLVYLERLKLDTPARAVCVVHSMQPSPNYIDLLFEYSSTRYNFSLFEVFTFSIVVSVTVTVLKNLTDWSFIE